MELSPSRRPEARKVVAWRTRHPSNSEHSPTDRGNIEAGWSWPATELVDAGKDAGMRDAIPPEKRVTHWATKKHDALRVARSLAHVGA